MRLNDLPGFREVFLGVSIGIADIDLTDQISRRFCLPMEYFTPQPAHSDTRQHHETDLISITHLCCLRSRLTRQRCRRTFPRVQYINALPSYA